MSKIILEIDKKINFLAKNTTLFIKNVHFGSKKAILTKKKRLRQHAGTTTKVLSKKKRLRQHEGTKTKVLAKKNQFFFNISKMSQNELKICFSYYLGASENDFDNEMPPNT
mgnify:CR=1 FL=1